MKSHGGYEISSLIESRASSGYKMHTFFLRLPIPNNKICHNVALRNNNIHFRAKVNYPQPRVTKLRKFITPCRIPKECKESWLRGPGFVYPQRGFALLKVH